MELTGSERILVLKPSSLGDIVHTLPAVAAISTQHLDPGQSGLGQGFGRRDAPSDF